MFKKKENTEFIIIKNLNFFKQSNKILNNINLKISNTGITFIIGPNGSGKTYLLRCIHGLEKYFGEILFDNKLLCDDIKTKQSFVFNQPILLRRSVYENMIFFAKQRKIKDFRNQCLNILKLVQLNDSLEKPATALSSGEKQRLCLARAISTEPQVLFLDEPTSHLDPFSLKIIENVIKRVAKFGSKIVFISHDLNQVRRLGDDVIFMKQGKVIEQNDITSFFYKPKTSYANSYIKGDIVI